MMTTIPPNFSSVRRSPTMRPQQDFSRSFCSCSCPPLLSCSFLVPLGLLSHYLSTSLVVFLCFLFPPFVRIALLPVVCLPPSLLRARTTSAFFSDVVYQCDLLSQLLSGNLVSYPVEICGYSIFATWPVPVAQDRYRQWRS